MGLVYVFEANGTYTKAYQSDESSGACTTGFTAFEEGVLDVDDTTLTTSPNSGHMVYEATCSPELEFGRTSHRSDRRDLRVELEPRRIRSVGDRVDPASDRWRRVDLPASVNASRSLGRSSILRTREGVEIVPQDLGFDQVQEANFSRYLAALAAGVRVLDRAIALGVDRCEAISVGGTVHGIGGAENAPFIQSQTVLSKFRGAPAELAELIKSVNDRDAAGRRLVLEEVRSLGRPETVRAGESAAAEWNLRVFLVNLDAIEEAAQ